MAKPTWLNLSTQSGSGDNSFAVSAAPHTGRLARSGDITVQGYGITGSKIIRVSQAYKPEFVKFNSSTYAVDKEGGTLTITGKSNAAKLQFALTGKPAQGGATSIQMYFPVKNNPDKTDVVEHDGETAQFIDNISSYTAAGKVTNNNTDIEGDPGASNEYEFTVQIPFVANTASAEQQIKLQVRGSSSTIADTTVITQAKAEAFLKVYNNAAHSGDEVTAVELVNAGTAQTLYVDSNTSWTVS